MATLAQKRATIVLPAAPTTLCQCCPFTVALSHSALSVHCCSCSAQHSLSCIAHSSSAVADSFWWAATVIKWMQLIETATVQCAAQLTNRNNKMHWYVNNAAAQLYITLLFTPLCISITTHNRCQSESLYGKMAPFSMYIISCQATTKAQMKSEIGRGRGAGGHCWSGHVVRHVTAPFCC